MSLEDTQPKVVIPLDAHTGVGGNIINQDQHPLELAPGIPVDDELIGLAGDRHSLYAMERHKELVAEASMSVADWLNEHGKEIEQQVADARDPALPDRTVLPMDPVRLEIFAPKERKKRQAEAVEFTTGSLLEALHPDEKGESFIKRLLPSEISVSAAMVLIDKDTRYRNMIAAACYRVLDQQAEYGLLDAYERVKSNNTNKTVNHGDAAIKQGRSRDVVVGMVLDMLSGRFNAEENQRTSKAMGDHERDANGVFRGGQHSGAAYGVLRSLVTAQGNKVYFEKPYYTRQEQFELSLQAPKFLEEIADPTLKLGTWEEKSLDEGIEMHTKKGEVKQLTQDATDLMIMAGNGSRPISLRRMTMTDPEGKEQKVTKVRYIREAGAVEHLAQQNAKALGISWNTVEYKKLVDDLIRRQGYEFILPEGAELTVGRDISNTVDLKGDDMISRRHCKIKVVDGKFVIEDTSTNGTVFKYSGANLTKATARRNSDYAMPTVRRLQPGESLDPGWDAFTARVEAERTHQKRAAILSPTRRRVEATRRSLKQAFGRRKQ